MCTAQAVAGDMPWWAEPLATRGDSRRFYRVARRPLDIPYQYKLYQGNSSKPGSRIRREHQQFIGSDGRNFGFMKEGGVREDTPRLSEYAFDIPDYGTTKYDAQCIEQARAEVEKEWRETLDTGAELARRHADFPQDMDDSWRYGLLRHNCQDYVADVLRRAEAIARTKGVPLIVE